MADSKNMIVVWVFAPLGRSLQVFNSSGKLKDVKIGSAMGGDGGEKEFLAVLDEYADNGWELVDTSTLGNPAGYTIRAFLQKR
jgi:hypothetical protein